MLNDYIKDIINIKRGDILDFPENEINFSPYTVQRFISMLSPEICEIVNEVTNKRLSTLTKKQFYRLLLIVIPKQNKSYIKYFKKEKEDFNLTDKQKSTVDFLCSKYKLSYREVKTYIKTFDLNVDIF